MKNGVCLCVRVHVCVYVCVRERQCAWFSIGTEVDGANAAVKGWFLVPHGHMWFWSTPYIWFAFASFCAFSVVHSVGCECCGFVTKKCVCSMRVFEVYFQET